VPAGAGRIIDLVERRHLLKQAENVALAFVAVDFEVSGAGDAASLRFTTNVDDEVSAGPDHPIRVTRDPVTGETAPYVHIRAGLEALIDRKSFYRLVEIGQTETVAGVPQFGVRSGGAFFPFIPASDLEA